MAAALLLGRGDELDLIGSLLAGEGGAAVLLRGDPGIGKTALLAAAAVQAEASGRRVLRAAGVEYEAELPFSGLHQLLHPVRTTFDHLAPNHRHALDRAFAVVDGPPPDRLVLSLAALAALERAALERPLLVTVDDLQWVDPSTVEVLLFVARRLDDVPLVLLAATRDREDALGIPVRDIEALSDEPATELLRAQHPDLSPMALARLLGEAAGNPLGLLELPRGLTEAQRTGGEALPASLPLTRRLERLFADRVSELPASTRYLLVLAALEGTGSRATVHDAAGEDWSIDALAPAEEADLLLVGDATLSFRHPLVRSAIVQMAPTAERRAAHEALAAALGEGSERRAWHLAGAAVGADEKVAQAVEEAARLATRRGGGAEAATWLARAAELSPISADRSRRFAEAAFLANQTGQPARARALLEEAGTADGRGAATHAAATEAYLLLNRDGDLHGAHRLLVDALSTATRESISAEWANDTLYMLLVTCYLANAPEPWADFDAALLGLAPEPVTEVLSMCRDAMGDPVRTAHGMRARVEAAFAALPDEVAPWQVTRLGSVCGHVDALDVARSRLRQVVELERDGGAQDSWSIAVSLLSLDAFVTGRWDECEALAQEGLAVIDAGGYQVIGGTLRYRLGLLAAARGEWERSEAISAQLLAWSAAHGVGQWEATAWHCRTVAALSRGDYGAAFALASRVSPPGVLAAHVPQAPWLVLDLVEAAVRIGRLDDARAHVEAAERAGVGAVSSRMGLVAAGAAALVRTDDTTGEQFEAALALDGSDDWPFERARIRLAHGEWLRRVRAGAPAADELLRAKAEFDRLGARPWSDRAAQELRAMGRGLGPRAKGSPVGLTAQELEIARLAASGLSNKEIGERLFLSHRTVGTHLYRAFPKLGITSRAALRDALVAAHLA